MTSLFRCLDDVVVTSFHTKLSRLMLFLMSIVLSEDVALEVDKILIEMYSDEESESGESENEGSDSENEATKCVSCVLPAVLSGN